MGKHAIVGAGPVGTATALALVDGGHDVVVVTRSGSGPDHPGVRRVACDASDPVALAAAVGRPDALYNCANPPYHRWPQLWPPMASAMLEVATTTGAVLVTMGNLYGYGPGRPPDDRGRPAGRHRHQGAGPCRHVGRRPRRPPRRAGAGDRGPGVRLLRARRRSSPASSAATSPDCWPEGRPTCSATRTRPTPPRTSPTWGGPWPCSARMSAPGAGRGTSRPHRR